MNSPSPRRVLQILFVAVLLGVVPSGCGRDGPKQVEAAKVEEVPKQIEEAFATAPAEARQAAQDLSASIPSQPVDAFFGLQALGYRSDLTPEQRTALAQAMLAARAQLAQAAANGNSAARDALEQQAARK
ncbi:MAG: hypothetical protein JNL10_15175 [Verrucomicrobiales bacterium]|nr:hypothetical protein [Verrucomicrobiales bacterium]